MAFVSAIPLALSRADTRAGCSGFTTRLPSTSPVSANRPRTSTLRRSTMPITCSGMGLSFPDKMSDGGLRIGIVKTRWNTDYVEAMHADVKAALLEKGVKESEIVLMEVPGAYELPMATRLMCAAQKVDAVVCIGVLIKGETDHYEYIANAVSTGLMDLQLTLSIPIVFGVLTCRTEEQAKLRSLGDKSNAGDWGRTAVEMAELKKLQYGGVKTGKKSVGFA